MKKLMAIFTILIVVAFVSIVIAQEKPAPPKPTPSPATPPGPAKEEKPKIEKFSGVIEKIDEAGKTIDVKRGAGKTEKILTFAVTDQTKITRGKDTLSFSDLKQKMNVSIEYKKEGDKLIALSIKVAVPKTAAPKEKKPEEAPKK